MKKLVFLCAAIVLAGCAQQGGEPPALRSDPGQAPPEPPPQTAAPAGGDMKPVPQYATEGAPAQFQARFKTTKGDVVLQCTRAWSPNGADRFYNLVKLGYFTDVAFFRVLGGFMAQFGIHGDPAISAQWRPASIPDDPGGKASNARGFLSYAMAGPNTRTTQLFINYADNSRLDGMGFTPLCQVAQGLEVVDKLYNGYGEGAPQGRGPDQGRIQMEGNAYLKRDFPNLDYVLSAALE